MTEALTIKNLTKVYRNDIEALKSISFSVKEGDFFALLGPNGAGKSTTIGIITSLVTKTSGEVKVFDYDLDTQLQIVKSKIGLVPQEFNFSIFQRVIDILVNQAGYYGIDKKQALLRAEKYLNKLHLWEKRFEVARNLSGGQKRRLMIARALIHEPPLLILDEPTAGVDIEVRRDMWQFLTELNQQGTTIILTTHYLEEAETLCKNIAIIDRGVIIENTAMSDLLRKLNTETFILYCENELKTVPVIEKYPTQLIDKNTISVELNAGQNINAIFEILSKQNIKIISMRNKTNRLEELFLRLTARNGES